jgi:hypothetical protein
MIALLLLVSCGTPDPDPCAEMCAAATQLLGLCLDEWNADWSAAGYADAPDHFDACETWAWELRTLEADAAARDVARAEGAVDRTCVSRRDAFTAPGASCETYTTVDWNARPWTE